MMAVKHRKMENGTTRAVSFFRKKKERKNKKIKIKMLQNRLSISEFLGSLQISLLNKKRKLIPVLVRVLASGVNNRQVQAFLDAVVDATKLGMLENVRFEILHTEQVSYTSFMSL